MRPKKAYDNPDFMHSREARTLRILSEYLEPEKRFIERKIRHTIVFFGSARIKPGNGGDNGRISRYYTIAEELAYSLANLGTEIEKNTGEGFLICTGGGSGIMEAANRGAARAGAHNIGFNISLPFEQVPNKFISPDLNFEFHYFFMRKYWFLYQAKAIIIFPGGFGTLDEMFETLTLLQTRKLEKAAIPILLHHREFWEEIINFDKLIEYGLISPEDMQLFQYFETSADAMEILKPKIIDMMQDIHQYLQIKFPK